MKTGTRRSVLVMIGGIAMVLVVALWWNRINAGPKFNVPPRQLPNPNAFDFYVKAAKLHARIAASTLGAGAIDPVTDSRSTIELTPQQLARQYPTAKKVAWVKKNAPALQLLRQGFAYEYSEATSRSLTSLYPHYSQYRSLARLLVIESHAHSEQGDWAGASRSTLDILRLGHDVPKGAPLIGALVGYAIDAIGLKELQRIRPHLNAAATRAAVQHIEKLEASRSPFAEAIREEKWGGLNSLKQTMRGTGWRVSVLRGMAGGTVSWTDFLSLHSYSKHTIMSNYVTYMDALIAQAGKPYLKQQAPTVPKDPLNRILLPVFARAGWSAARDETGNKILMLQLALRAFQLEHGRLPDTLGELTPTYLKKVPHDPFGGGEALRYRKTGNTYVLYSIGPDGRDDGGKPIDRPEFANRPGRRYLLQSDSKGDYVAGINR